jgi:hypothetical protein
MIGSIGGAAAGLDEARAAAGALPIVYALRQRRDAPRAMTGINDPGYKNPLETFLTCVKRICVLSYPRVI